MDSPTPTTRRSYTQARCSICRETGHYAPTCNSHIIEEKANSLWSIFNHCTIIGTDANPQAERIPTTIKQQIKHSFRSLTGDWSVVIWKRVFAKFESRFSRSSPSNRPLYRNFIRLTTEEYVIHPRIASHYVRLMYKFSFYVIYKQRDIRYLNEFSFPSTELQEALDHLPDLDVEENRSTILARPVETPPIPSLANGDVSPVPIIHSDTLFDTPRADDTHMPATGYSPPPAPRRMRSHPRRVHNSKPPIQICMDKIDTEYIRDDACPICMEVLQDDKLVALGCRHAFCSGCAGEFIKRCNGKCPSCRETIEKVHFQAAILPDHFNTLMESIR